MKSSALLPEKLHGYNYKKERWMNMGKLAPVLFPFLGVSLIFSFFILCPPYPFDKSMPKGVLYHKHLFIKPQRQSPNDDHENLLVKPLSENEKLITPPKDAENLIKPKPLQQILNNPVKENENWSKPLPEKKESSITSGIKNLKKPPFEDDDDDEKCDLFKGHWVPDVKGSVYTNSSCITIPSSKNCLMQGRPDSDFLNWRWKPDDCELPRFNSKSFLESVRAKKITFIGDSVARNHMESLLCLLSKEETPMDVYKDTEDRNRVWYFPNHNFTLSTIWTQFLVAGEERTINGSGAGIFDLYLDKVDTDWFDDLPTVDIAIVSAGHWFFRPIILHQGSKIYGCIYCNEPNVTNLDASVAIKKVFEAVFRQINKCNKCKEGLVTLLRTFSPSHFENGTWNTGGGCRRTEPFSEKDVDAESHDLWMRKSQVEAIEQAKEEGKRSGKKFGVLDITRAMLMRSDGHPHAYWGNKWMKGYNDCVHWCLPGPIDVWSDFLMAVLRRLSLVS